MDQKVAKILFHRMIKKFIVPAFQIPDMLKLFNNPMISIHRGGTITINISANVDSKVAILE